MEFLVDEKLGKLLKWLRILGFDAIPARHAESMSSQASSRIRLTRFETTAANDSCRGHILIESDRLIFQLRQIIQTLGITPADIRLFSRCIACNCTLVAADKNQIRGDVPDYIWHTTDDFSQCPRCLKLFWPGSHTRNSLAVFSQLFKADPVD